MLQVMDKTRQDNQNNVGDDKKKAGYTALGAPKHLYEKITNRNTILTDNSLFKIGMSFKLSWHKSYCSVCFRCYKAPL